MENQEELIGWIKQQLLRKETVIVAIDGRCGSGKSTFASVLANELDGEVIRLDDFFLPSQLRTTSRLQQPGENIHHERFNEEIMLPLSRGEEPVLQPYDCKTSSYQESRSLPKKQLYIIEGSYSLYPKVKDIYDLKIFMTVDVAIQEARIAERNGIEGLKAFQQKWIPSEEKYFSQYDIENQCDAVIDTTDGKGFFEKGSKQIEK